MAPWLTLARWGSSLAILSLCSTPRRTVPSNSQRHCSCGRTRCSEAGTASIWRHTLFGLSCDLWARRYASTCVSFPFICTRATTSPNKARRSGACRYCARRTRSQSARALRGALTCSSSSAAEGVGELRSTPACEGTSRALRRVTPKSGPPNCQRCPIPSSARTPPRKRISSEGWRTRGPLLEASKRRWRIGCNQRRTSTRIGRTSMRRTRWAWAARV
mmetsp:Transcript_11547/g.30875  ORF Transcript_11547/g.30875 Transcript_11547/m.30875 type:complete len:218 (+) Transcript_11547:411-1064(+)